MKLIIGYPPIPSLGTPACGQNRQYQELNAPSFQYPMVPAYAATMLHNAGHTVRWMDGPAEGDSWPVYLAKVRAFAPDLIAWEVKTPTVKRVWPLVDIVKRILPETRVVLMGDHVTALPNETLEACDVDHVIVGGDFDFSLLNLAGAPAKGSPGIKKSIIDLGTSSILSALPILDRNLTKWELYAERNGNYKYTPATYTYFGRDCWWRQGGGCTFCSWTNTFKNFRVVSVDQAMAEVESCASLGIREIFDDTGTFPGGAWLAKFCEAMRKFNKGERHGRARICIGCNSRPGALVRDEWEAMGAAGFRFILFGLESASQRTLDRINKGQSPGDMERSARMAKRAGLEPHVTCMVGYPWESREEALDTIRLARRLFERGWIDTLQATIVIPYPGTELFRQCEERGWLRTEDWNAYDMREPIMHCPMSDEEVLAMTRGIYKSCITPRFMLRKLFGIRSRDDIRYIWRGIKYVAGHLRDFGGRQPGVH